MSASSPTDVVATLRAMRAGGGADDKVPVACIGRLTEKQRDYLARFVEPNLGNPRFRSSFTRAEEFFGMPPHRDLCFEVVERGDGFDKNVVKVFLNDWNLSLHLKAYDIELVSGVFNRVPKSLGYHFGRKGSSYGRGPWPTPRRAEVVQKVVTY